MDHTTEIKGLGLLEEKKAEAGQRLRHRSVLLRAYHHLSITSIPATALFPPGEEGGPGATFPRVREEALKIGVKTPNKGKVAPISTGHADAIVNPSLGQAIAPR